jgi:hypothetical protein
VLTARYNPTTGRRAFLFYVGTVGPVSNLTLFIGWMTPRADSGRFKEERNFLPMPVSKLDPSVF